MKRTRFLMVGGFLGAGKTTTIARLAKHYTDRGTKVGIVTNDQAYNLVDTESLRAQGFRVGEVPGACFCCKFDDLIETSQQLGQTEMPEIIIAEPVGSCTDLVATVIEPLRHLYDNEYEIGPLAVLLKPEHGQKILRDQQGVGFSPKAAYIFLKQIEEADIVVLNKIDKLTSQDRDELVGLIGERFPEKRVLAISARDGSHFDILVDSLQQPGPRHTQLMEVDYDVYAEGEAELGWLNCQLALSTADRFPLDEVLVELVSGLRDVLAANDCEPAHIKVMGQCGQDAGIANLVGSGVDVELSLASEINVRQADVIVNARVAADPEHLEDYVHAAIDRVVARRGLDAAVSEMQRFRPGRPVPTHRITS